MRVLPMTLRLKLRDWWSAALGTIPLAVLDPVRSSYVRAPKGSLRRKVLRLLLCVLRYRRPDRSLRFISPADNPDLRLVNSQSIIVQRIFWLGEHGYEGPVVDWWRRLCRNATRILEVGGNIGYYTVQGAKAAPGTPYTVVEAHPTIAAILRQNLDLNGIDHIEVISAAMVGQREADKVELRVPEVDTYEAPTGAFVAGSSEPTRLKASSRYRVPVVEAIDAFGGADLVKLDVEGAEFDILSAVLGIIRSRRPTLIIEVNPDTPKLRSLLASLCRQLNYSIYAITLDGLRPVDPVELGSVDFKRQFKTRDVLLTTRTDLLGESSGSQ